MLALTAAIVGFGVFSSSIGTGALPTDSLPPFGVTAGAGSLSTVAELGDVNGDHIGDYAVGLPSAQRRRGRRLRLPRPERRALPADAHGAQPRERLVPRSPATRARCSGYTVVGDDVNDDGLADIAIGAPMAGAPGKSGGGAVYVVFGSPHPDRRRDDDALVHRPDAPIRSRRPRRSAAATTASSRTRTPGMSLAALPDVNGDGFNDLAVGAPDADLHITGGGGVAVLYGKPEGVHITLNDLWEKAYPYFFHVDFPARPASARESTSTSA